MKIVECVPNFSEGRDHKVIDGICDSIRLVPGVSLLDVDPGAATNRTVMTIIGEPDAVMEAAFRGIKKAAETIDMSRQKGEHPRMGATDVCPFVPVSGITMEECAEMAVSLGRRVGEELGIPVYLYEFAASRPERKNLANIRAGEYEGLAAKLQNPEWVPDFGPCKFNPGAGATAIGAREFLVAFNINLNTRNKALAHDIALEIRESGRAQRDANGKIEKDGQGNKIMLPGMFQEIKAVGWYIDEYQTAQISINFTNYKVSPPHLVVETVRKLAMERGLVLTGCELVGLTPLEALLMAGKYYLEQQGMSPGVPEAELVRIAIKSMGLSELAPFDPLEKIIDYRVRPACPLCAMNLKAFADELSSDSPAPGGGSVAAYCGALAAGLGTMVCNLTIGKKGYENVSASLMPLAIQGQGLKDFFLSAVDRDTEAFNGIMAAMKMPRKSDEEIATRMKALTEATVKAIEVPLGVLENCDAVLPLLETVADHGNPNSISDAGVGVMSCLTAAHGAYLNVMINLKGLENPGLADGFRVRAASALEKIDKAGMKLYTFVRNRVES